MSGIQMTPIRWPDRWDPAFMDRLIREVFAKADVRNANAGTGITITGTPDEVATISASQDIEDLLAGGPLTALASGVDTARQVVAGDGSIIITDNGGGGTLEIAVGTIQLTQLGALPDLSVIGVPSADDGFDLPTSINALANDTVLRRVNDELDWGVLTPGMFPDATVAAWDSTEIYVSTALFDLHGDVQIDGDLTLSGGDLSITGGVEVLGGNDLVVFDSSGNDSLTISLDGTDALLTLASVTAWRVSGAAQLEFAGGMDLWIRDAGFLRIYDSTDTDYGQFSHDGTSFNAAFVNTVTVNFTGATGYYFDETITIDTAAALVFNGPGTLISRDDTNDVLQISGGNTTSLSDGAILSLYGDDHATEAGNFFITHGASGYIGMYRIVRFLDPTASDYAEFVHDGTDFNTTFVNTGEWDISGLTQMVLRGQMAVTVNLATSAGQIIENTSSNAAATAQLAIFNDAGNYIYIYKRSTGGGQISVIGTNGALEFHTSDTQRMILPVGGIGDFADDAAAAAGSVPVNGIYRTGSVLKIRVS